MSLNYQVKILKDMETRILPNIRIQLIVEVRRKQRHSLFHKIEIEEASDKYVAPFFINRLEAYDDEINLGQEENMISNEFAVKLYLDHKFIINPEEDDVEPGVVLGRSFMCLTKGITDFGNGIITIYPELDPFLDSSGETENTNDDWDLLLDDLDFVDVPEIEGVEIPPFVYKMGKNSRNKINQLKKYQLIYSDMGPSLSTRKPLTHEEASREALAIDICRRFSILEEERPVIETMAYSDNYKKILDEICIDKMELDGEMKKPEEGRIIKVKGEALIEKEDPRAFVILIRLEAKINLNALADTGSDINVMPYRVYKELDKEEVGVTTIIAKFLILDMRIERDTPILVGRGFLYTCGSILNIIERIISTFDGICHQTFRAAKTNLNTEESDSDDEEDYEIQMNSFGAPMYGPKPAKYLNCNDLFNRSIALQELLNPFKKICVWKKAVSFLGSLPVALQQEDWKPEYTGNYCKNEEGDG
ncbi:hypothetical protein Tco_0527074 [Tanacetum coccineum]